MVDFEQVKKRVKELQFDTVRLDSDDIFEAVIIKKNIGQLISLLESFFDLPVFPSKNKLSSEICHAINPFGGIGPGQTLYYSNLGSSTVFAMIWPWQDGQNITVKIIKR